MPFWFSVLLFWIMGGFVGRIAVDIWQERRCPYLGGRSCVTIAFLMGALAIVLCIAPFVLHG